MVENIVFILGFFILFYFFLLFYDLFCLYYHQKEDKIDEKRKEKLKKWIIEKEEAKENTKIGSKLFRKLKHLSYLSAFANLLEENVIIQKQHLKDIVKKDTYTSLFVLLSHYYQKKDDLSASYYAYVLRFVQVDGSEINAFLEHCLLSKSLYCIENALLAFYYLGNVDAVIDAYLLMTRRNVDYGYKLVADGLLQFQGSKVKLCQKLYAHFDQFNASFQIGFLTFFRQTRYHLKEELYKRIEQNHHDKEVTIEMIRYFSKIRYEKIASLLLERLEKNAYHDFEYDVVMIQTLAEYPSAETIKVLQEALSHTNYYVRYNAAKSLHRMTDLTKIRVKDPFAKEMLASFIEEV